MSADAFTVTDQSLQWSLSCAEPTHILLIYDGIQHYQPLYSLGILHKCKNSKQISYETSHRLRLGPIIGLARLGLVPIKTKQNIELNQIFWEYLARVPMGKTTYKRTFFRKLTVMPWLSGEVINQTFTSGGVDVTHTYSLIIAMKIIRFCSCSVL